MKRKLKTMAKILEENPEAVFDESGCLGSPEWGMSTMAFHKLGREVDGESWSERFLEPLPPERKALGWISDCGAIYWALPDSRDAKAYDLEFTRAPEFDIVAKAKEEG